MAFIPKTRKGMVRLGASSSHPSANKDRQEDQREAAGQQREGTGPEILVDGEPAIPTRGLRPAQEFRRSPYEGLLRLGGPGSGGSVRKFHGGGGLAEF